MSPPAPSLEAALAQLYSAPPDDFVSTRQDLVRALREAGRREDAQRVAQERKPTLPAWAVNQLAHRHREELSELVTAGDALREHADDREELRRWNDRVRELTGQLCDHAAAALAEIGTDPATHLDAIERTLTTAALVPEERAPVLEGILLKPLAAAGFGALTGVELPASPGEEPTPSGERAQRRERVRQLERERRQLERHVGELERDLERARDEGDRLRAQLDQAEREVEERGAKLERARAELASVEEELASTRAPSDTSTE